MFLNKKVMTNQNPHISYDQLAFNQEPIIIHESSTTKEDLLVRANAAIEEIRPYLAVDGGNVEIVDITDDMVLQLRWIGNCIGCHMSSMTMKAGVEQSVKARIPEIKSVIALN